MGQEGAGDRPIDQEGSRGENIVPFPRRPIDKTKPEEVGDPSYMMTAMEYIEKYGEAPRIRWGRPPGPLQRFLKKLFKSK